LSGSLILHDAPVPPELELPLEPELLAPLLPLELVPELPLELVPELPLELVPELPLELVPELPLEEPVSAAASFSTVLLLVEGGSFAPSGSGSTFFVSSRTAAPSPSSTEVAQAMRATSDRAPTAVRVKRLMAGTLAAELYPLLVPLDAETLR